MLKMNYSFLKVSTDYHIVETILWYENSQIHDIRGKCVFISVRTHDLTPSSIKIQQVSKKGLGRNSNIYKLFYNQSDKAMCPKFCNFELFELFCLNLFSRTYTINKFVNCFSFPYSVPSNRWCYCFYFRSRCSSLSLIKTLSSVKFDYTLLYEYKRSTKRFLEGK